MYDVRSRTVSFSERYGKAIVLIISLLAIFLFVYTGYTKAVEFDRFQSGLARLASLRPYSTFLAAFIIISEFVIAGLLMFQRTILLGLYAFTGMITGFTVFILYLLISGSKLPCYCGGVIESLNWVQHSWFNLAFIILGLIGIYYAGATKNQ